MITWKSGGTLLNDVSHEGEDGYLFLRNLC